MNIISKFAAASIVALAAAAPVIALGATSPVNYGSLISSLQTGATADFSAVTDATTVTFVTVSSLKTSGDTAALDNALSKNADAAAALQTQVEANAVLVAKITAAGFTADQVIAASAAADGSLTVFVDDRA